MSIPVISYKNIAFSTQFRYMNIYSKGTTSATIPAVAFATATATIPHNLGYNPFFRVMVKPPSASPTPNNIFNGIAGFFTYSTFFPFQVDNVHADSTNLYVTVSTDFSGTGGTFTIYYRIYKEPR